MRTMIVAAVLLIVSAPASAKTFEELLGRQQVDQLVRQVTSEVVTESQKNLSRDINTDGSYFETTTRLVGLTQTDLDAAAARWRLRGLYGVFATHAVQFLAQQAKEGPLTLSAETVKAYLVYAQGRRRCGESPCDMTCNPCNRECDKC